MWYKPLESFTMVDDLGEFLDNLTWIEPVRELESDFIKAIEALKGETLHTETSKDGYDYYKNIEIIEKAYGKKWEELQ